MIDKTTYTFVVYHENDDPPISLRHAIAESYDGSMVGAVTNERTDAVHPDNLRDELIAIDNDGTFFDRE